MDSRSTSTILPNSIRDEIIDFHSLLENVTRKLNLQNWMVLPSQQTLHIFNLNIMLNGNLSIRNTICIHNDLVVKVFGENSDEMLSSLQLKSWPQLQTLIEQCGVHIKREVDSELAVIVDKATNSETNTCEIKDQRKETLAIEMRDINTKEEFSDHHHQPLIELVETSISESEPLECSNIFVSQSSLFHEAPSIYSEYDNPSAKLLPHKDTEARTRQSQLCPICNKAYAVDKMDRHMQQHFNGECYQCHVCGREFRYLISLLKHAKMNHITAGDEFFCGICKNASVFNTKESIEEHMKNRHCKPSIEDVMNCSICGKDFFTVQQFNAHVRRHDRSRWKACPICNKRYGSLTRHMNGRHLNIRNYVCDICGSAYTQWTSLKEHIETKHMLHNRRKEKEAPSVFPCETCGKTFAFRRLLNQHATLHSGKLHFCDECGQSFRHPKYLQKHLKQHRDVVKLRCTMCEKEYVQKVGLRLHMAKIHGVIGTAPQ